MHVYIYSTHSHTYKVARCVEPLTFLLSQYFSSYFRKIFLPLFFLFSPLLVFFSWFNPSHFLFYLNLWGKKETKQNKTRLNGECPRLSLWHSGYLSNFFHGTPQAKRNASQFCFISISMYVLTTEWLFGKQNTQTLKEKSFYFILRNPQLLTNGMCVCACWVQPSPQSWESDWMLSSSFLIPHWFSCRICFYVTNVIKIQLCKVIVSLKHTQQNLKLKLWLTSSQQFVLCLMDVAVFFIY